MGWRLGTSLYERWSLELFWRKSQLSRHLKDEKKGGEEGAGTHQALALNWEAGNLGHNELLGRVGLNRLRG